VDYIKLLEIVANFLAAFRPFSFIIEAMIDKVCETCGKGFQVKNSKRDFARCCSRACFALLRRKSVTVNSQKWCNSGSHFAALSDFNVDQKRKDGLQVSCKECRKAQWRATHEVPQFKLAPKGTKWCNKCRSFVPCSLFNANKRKANGLDVFCKTCRGTRNIIPSDILEARKTFVQDNPNMKWCNTSEHFMPRTDFNKSSRYPDGLDTRCRSCKSKAEAKLYEANKETINERHKREYRQNIEKRRAYGARYRSENREKVNAAIRRHYHANIERHKQKGREWVKNNPEKHRAKGHRRRARMAKAEGYFTPEQLRAKFEFWGYRCLYCKFELTPQTAQTEHRKPIARGGSNWIANVAPACAKCNHSKRDKTETEFREWRTRTQALRAA
jgi:5-methylcytosine-specific restriction endonuclease McrA